MQHLNDWNVEGAFARNYTMFGLLVVVLFCLLWLAKIYDIALIIFASLLFFFGNEYVLTHKLNKLISDPEYDFPYTPTSVIIYSILYFIAALLLILVYIGYFTLTINAFDKISCVVTYIRSLVISLAIFYLYLMLKIILVGLRIVSPFQIKRGIFAIFHRFTVFVRSLVVFPLWLNFFSKTPGTKLIPTMISQDFNTCKCYLIAKSIFFAQLIWDFDVVRYTFYLSYRKLFALNQCINVKNCDVCQSEAKNQIELPCGHVFCSECLEKELKRKPFCPVCLEPPMNDPKVAFFDGSVSLSSIFCCF